MSDKYIVRVIRKRTVPSESTAGHKEEVDQIFEQEFDKMDIGEFAVMLNRKDGKQKDSESIKA